MIKIIALFLLFSPITYAKLIKVAVLDSGINWNNNNISLCEYGHKDFTGMGLEDNMFHGQNISHLIDREAKYANYCQIIIKVFDSQTPDKTGDKIVRALKHTKTLNIDLLNVSFSGIGQLIPEKVIILDMLMSNVFIFAAAGNDKMDFTKKCNSYPACYDSRIFVVGNIQENGIKHPTSNYGPQVDFYEIGVNQKAGGVTLTGSSQSTAIATGKFIKMLDTFYKRKANDKR